MTWRDEDEGAGRPREHVAQNKGGGDPNIPEGPEGQPLLVLLISRPKSLVLKAGVTATMLVVIGEEKVDKPATRMKEDDGRKKRGRVLVVSAKMGGGGGVWFILEPPKCEKRGSRKS